MTPFMLRHLWSLVETTQPHVLLNMDDASLVQWLIRQFRSQHPIDYQETTVLTAYIRSRLSLIRDLAQNRPISYR